MSSLSKKKITKSAEILYISQPALTKRLMQIEEQFGVKIMDRGIRGVQLTSHGEYLAHRAKQALSLPLSSLLLVNNICERVEISQNLCIRKE